MANIDEVLVNKELVEDDLVNTLNEINHYGNDFDRGESVTVS